MICRRQDASANPFPETFATTTVAILNMMLNPEIFHKARAEIDRVVGTERLPTLDDRPHLRYIDYLVEETSRWRPLSPIGIPHRSLEDDVYNGMFIPKGFVRAGHRCREGDR